MKVGILGAGAWGISLAYLFSKKHDITIWEFNKEAYLELVKTRKIDNKLKGFTIPEEIKIVNNIFDALEQDIIINAVPTQFIRSYFSLIENYDFSKKIFINVSKGIEVKTGMDIRQMFLNFFPSITDDNFVIMAGPSFANEISINPTPTAIVAAGKNLKTANFVRDQFSSENFRIYSSSDVIGVEIGGSIKNIIAIAAGISDGLGLGNNTKAALLTRGLAEMNRFGVYLGGKRETFSGLSGIGDMILTANSNLSRNYQVGYRIAQGEKLEEIIASMVMVAEGVETARIVKKIAEENKISMPITRAIYDVLFENVSPKESIKLLMERTHKEED